MPDRGVPEKHLTPGRYRERHFGPTKKRRHCQISCEFEKENEITSVTTTAATTTAATTTTTTPTTTTTTAGINYFYYSCLNAIYSVY